MPAQPVSTPTAIARPRRLSRALPAAAVLALVGVVSACGYGSASDDGSAPATAAANASGKKLSASTVKIGYFANVTHATPLVGLEEGLFAKELGATTIKTQVFNAGPSEIEALNAGAIDIGWIGPSPAINGYAKSAGQSLKIISGATSGGVSLVVNPAAVKSLKDIKGKRIATPQLGNTQDVALLNWLAEQGYKVNADTGKGAVTVVRVDNKETPTLFQQGDLDGAWVPEPTAAKLVAEGGKVLLDEKRLWDGGKFVITNVIVSQNFLNDHPDVVEAVLRGSVRTNAWIAKHSDAAKADVNAALKNLSGKALPDDVIDRAWANVDVTNDPLAATLQTEADHAIKAGLLDKVDLTGIYSLTTLNKVLKAEGEPAVTDAGLG